MAWFRNSPRMAATVAGIETADAMTRGAEATRGGDGGMFTAIASAVALLFSAYSVYETSVRRPELHTFVPPVIQYAAPYNSNFEVFGIPVSVANLGARSGTVLSMDLEVTNLRSKEKKLFYSADIGRWNMESTRALAYQPFAPMTLAGKSTVAQSVLFYSREDEKVMQITDQAGGTYNFKITLNTAWPEDLGPLDRIWPTKPSPLEFQMVMGEMDHRAFQIGTLPLHTKDWRPAGNTQ
jgi:hypothetical protein